MEYYMVKLPYNDERIGIGYDAKKSIVWIGGYTRIVKHVTSVTFKYFRIPQENLIDRNSTQANRFRYYANIQDIEFRQGLRRLSLRFPIIPIKREIHKFT